MKGSLTGFALVLAFFLASCGGSDKKSASPKEKEEYKKSEESMGDLEKKNPLDFITVVSRDKKAVLHLFANRKITYTLTSRAKMVTYKDIDLSLEFYSETGSILEKDTEKVTKFLKPGESLTDKTFYSLPKGTDSIAVKVMAAKVAE